MLWTARMGWVALAALVVVPAAWGQEAKPAHEPKGPQQRFEQLDANRDGKITADEIPQDAPEHLKALLKNADKDHDGAVTLDELKAFVRQRRAQAEDPKAMAEKLFKKIDTNGDGAISPAEFQAAMEKFHQFMQQHAQEGEGHHGRHGQPDSLGAGRPAQKESGKVAPVAQVEPPRRPRDPAEARKRFEERFKEADKNGDGKLSRDEAFGPLKENFDKIDADHDGQLTPEEIQKAQEARRQEIAAKRAAAKAQEQGEAKADKKAEAKAEKRAEKRAEAKAEKKAESN